MTVLRGIGALAIVIYHWGKLVLGWPTVALTLAVDMFLVLSGFILLHVYQQHFIARGLAGSRGFFIARLARTYPLHLVTLVAIAILELLTGFRGRLPNLGDFIANLLMVHVLDGNTYNYPSWSISAEYACYFAFPLLATVRARARGAFDHLLPLALLVALPTFQWQLGRFAIDTGWPAVIRCWMSFGLGMVVFGWAERFPASRWSNTVTTGLVVLFLAAYGASGIELAAVLAMALIVRLAVTLRWERWNTSAGRVLVGLGLISYSLYLVHIPVFYVMVLVLQSLSCSALQFDPVPDCITGSARLLGVLPFVAVSLTISIATYRWIEVPGRVWLRRLWLPQQVTVSSLKALSADHRAVQ